MRCEWKYRRLGGGVKGFRCSCSTGREVRMDKIAIEPEGKSRSSETSAA